MDNDEEFYTFVKMLKKFYSVECGDNCKDCPLNKMLYRTEDCEVSICDTICCISDRLCEMED